MPAQGLVKVCIIADTIIDGRDMIVRHFSDPEVLRTQYRAHGGADAWMILTSQFMEGIEFLAYATLQPGKVIEEHIDPVEEIYHIYRGGGHMKVGDEVREVKEGDSVWIPAGAPHALENRTGEVTMVLVIAAYPFRRWISQSE